MGTIVIAMKVRVTDIIIVIIEGSARLGFSGYETGSSGLEVWDWILWSAAYTSV